MPTTIEAMQPGDWDAVRKIYLEGIATKNATFETDVPPYDAWDAAHHPFCRLVAKRDDAVVGWVALSPTSKRRVYAGVAEITIYIAAQARGQGIGKALMQRVIEESEREGIWTLQAGIFVENTVSIALHKKHGFREVGIRERIGQMDGIWRDVMLLERRSRVVGI